jgi:flagellum-specific ATP synthase
MVRRLLAAYAEHEDLISIGAYRRGANRVVDVAVEMRESIEELFRQHVDQKTPWNQVINQLQTLGAQCQVKLKSTPAAASAPQLAAASAA